MKPAELVERALRNSSKTRATILDPFGRVGNDVARVPARQPPGARDRTGPEVLRLDRAAVAGLHGRRRAARRLRPRVQRHGYGYFFGEVFGVKPIPPARQSPSMTSIDLPMPLHTRDMLVPGPTSLTHAGGVSEKAHLTARTGLPTRKEI